MDIPYTVTARPDTGLWNAKIGIWLFLASEVMLFGGLFSGYIFLRLGADFPWPFHALDIRLGFINTLVLILSSITVVMAWVSLKLKKWRTFQLFMVMTILCALVFLVIKGFEYNSKFHHYGIKLQDGSVVEGHIHKGDDYYFYKVDSVTFDLENSETKYLDQAELPVHEEHSATAGGEAEAAHETAAAPVPSASPALFKISTGEDMALTQGWLNQERKRLSADPNQHTTTVKAAGDVHMHFKPFYVRSASADSVTLRDGTVIKGKLEKSQITITVDRIDLRSVEEVAEKNDVSYSQLWNYMPTLKEGFITHNKKALEDFAVEHQGHNPTTDVDALLKSRTAHIAEDLKVEEPVITLDRKDVKFYSNFTPKYNTYYAIYFALTGLHGLHVIGGASVLAYFLIFGKKLFNSNPEHMANRVEVGGLFWHFVDLVWIFLFPILYLM